MAPLLVLRREAFEYGLLPATQLFPRLDSIDNIKNLKGELIKASTSSPCPSFPDRKLINASTLGIILGVNDSLAHVLVDTLISLKPHDNYDCLAAEDDLVDVYVVLMFLFMQTCHKPNSQSQRRDVGDVWPSADTPQEAPLSPKKGQSAALFSPTNRGKDSSDQDSSQLAYVAKQVPTLLSLLKEKDDHSPNISAVRFDRLALLLAPALPGSIGDTAPLSTVLPLFNAGAGGSAAVSAVQDWLSRNIGTGLPPLSIEAPRTSLSTASSTAASANKPDKPGSSSRQLQFGGNTGSQTGEAASWAAGRQSSNLHWTIEGVKKNTLVQRESDLGSMSDVKVSDCQDTVLYLLAPMKYCSISRCIDCTIVVGAVGLQLKIEMCERVQVIAASAQLRIHSCRDCTFCLAINRPPYILGDCRNLQMAPYNTFYDQLEAHLTTVGMSISPNRWDSPISLTRSPTSSIDGSASNPAHTHISEDHSSGKAVVSLLAPDQYMPFVVPFGPVGGG
eukprot:CAMPEP_0197867672 /NCGR_PEP_ID=MMETSP1438-20131217/44881_1 /TAXON_ID=1461541 /ORGANISM="Pterosperma sp., Strain CCMP1384" /LENGTH=503 /DNA_ID=CAMNT_0043486333 /DNA_START=133 /DNA_END=1640 /DNA_ORIENTATION=-